MEGVLKMQKIPVILDTDIGPDCDDAGALAILNQFCADGACEILAITHCTGSPYGLPTISAINRCFGLRAPLGTCTDRDFLSSGEALRYTQEIAKSFPHDYPEGVPQPAAVPVFREALAGAEDGSVTVISIGPLNNLAAYLCDRDTARLIAQKVKRLISMAGSFTMGNDFAEWNVEQDIPAAHYVARHWPTPILFCPFEAGENILTGEALKDRPGNPVSAAYRIYTNGGMLRPSWDLITVLAAFEEDERLMPLSDAGRVLVDERGVTCFQPEAGGQHRYMRPSLEPEALTRRLEEHLLRALRTMENGVS